VLGVDAKHLRELRWVWPTWTRYKPELREMPCVVFYDPAQVREDEMSFLRDHLQVRFVAWSLPHARSQREKMLTGFLHVPAREVRTPWYLKLDTDVIATGPGEWIKPEWFDADEQGELPVFIASTWGYSKPRYVMDLLDDWADGVIAFAGTSRLNLPYSSAAPKIRHPRIISWIFFGRTDWTREMTALLGTDGRMPFPSQDSFMFYCAQRLGCRQVREKMSEHCWAHLRHGQLKQRAGSLKTNPKPTGMSTRGVLYYNTGRKCVARLLVSLASLRKHYNGPVTLLSEGEESHPLCRRIGEAMGAEVREWDCGVPHGTNRVYLAKTRYHEATPYDLTVAIDTDTLVTGSIDELFDLAEQHTFCVAQLGDWRTNGRSISKRIRQWQGILPDFLHQAIAFGPAINCGVVAFHKDAPIYRDWKDYALMGRELFIPDEVSCQIILHRYPHRVLDGCWNRSCKYDDPFRPGTRIVHYHGKKHCRQGLPYGGTLWTAAYDEAVQQNLAGMRDWSPAGDQHLSRHIKRLRKERRKLKPVYKTSLWCRERGHFNRDQADQIAAICEQVRPRYVVETGFCTGRSSAAVLHNSRSWLKRMVSIDIDLDYKAPHGRRMATLLQDGFPLFQVIESSSREVLPADTFRQSFPDGVDLALIDGDHSYEGCTFDLESLAPMMAPGGVIIVDDYLSGPPNGTRIDSVTSSVDDFLVRHEGGFAGERWNKDGKGFCFIRKNKVDAGSLRKAGEFDCI